MAMLDGESAASTAKADKARRKQEKRRRQQQAKREAAEAEARAKEDGVAATATEPAPEPTTQQGVVFATVEPAVEQRGVGSAESPVAAKKKKKKKKKKAQSGLPQVRHTVALLAKAGVEFPLHSGGALPWACEPGRWRPGGTVRGVQRLCTAPLCGHCSRPLLP